MSRISVLAIAFSFMAGLGGWYWLSRSTDLAICDRAVTGLAPDAPLQLAAMLDRDCAIIYIGQSKDPARTAIDFGYPSLAYDYAPRSDVDAVLEAAVLEGDRGFFYERPRNPWSIGAGSGDRFCQDYLCARNCNNGRLSPCFDSLAVARKHGAAS